MDDGRLMAFLHRFVVDFWRHPCGRQRDDR